MAVPYFPACLAVRTAPQPFYYKL